MLWKAYDDNAQYLTLSGHKRAVLDLRWSRDSRQLFSSSADYTLSTWDADTGQRLRKHTGHEGMVNAIDVVKRGTELVVSGADDGAVSIWDPREKHAVTYLETKYPIMAVAVDPVGSLVFSAGVDDTISAWDVRKLYDNNNSSSESSAPRPLFTLQGHNDAVTSLRVSPDGQTLLSNSMDSTVRTWNIRPFVSGGVQTGASSRALSVYDGAPAGIENMLLRAVWNSDGRKIAAGSGSDHTVVIWDTFTKRILYKLPGHKGSVNDVSFSPIEPIVATASSDSTVILGELPVNPLATQ